ncbi:DUF2975 domain-containing protein [Caenorhabditis elegans]|uniref:DUF2975 domain-containing protein n=1 Tax=Caenorhabditis elegans TaxID=6239 RepID=D1YSH1_CAEEL|nr:DUF2975 domain-containing protein [Caenorhabditis elegans]CCD70840.1 DUF2975 domain-containing protein [Caenorhabditis elegans]|eukprot:NP_001256033.1 Uncharacterized protein CELE_T05B4.14 [Caenorhabditis elegans]
MYNSRLVFLACFVFLSSIMYSVGLFSQNWVVRTRYIYLDQNRNMFTSYVDYIGIFPLKEDKRYGLSLAKVAAGISFVIHLIRLIVFVPSYCKARELGLAGVRGTFSAILGVSIVIMLLSLTGSIGLMSQNITHNKNDKLMEVEYEAGYSPYLCLISGLLDLAVCIVSGMVGCCDSRSGMSEQAVSIQK